MGGGCPSISWKQLGHRRQVTDIHTVAKDLAIPYPFVANPHFLITGKYSDSSGNLNEIVLKHVFLAGHAANSKLLQRYLTDAHVEIRKRLGIN